MSAMCQNMDANGKQCIHRANYQFGDVCRIHAKTKNKEQSYATTNECQECECPICYEKLVRPITCPNGHKICENHYLQYITSTYDSLTNIPKGICFMCREPLTIDYFSQAFIKKLPNIMIQAQLKKAKMFRPPLPGQPVTLQIDMVLVETLKFLNIYK
jgi:hypothetical protein